MSTLVSDPPGWRGASGGARLSPLDRFFEITARGSTIQREIRGGFTTFFSMVYIVVLNPIILGSAADASGHKLSMAQLGASTALVAAIMTLLMGVGANLPLAIAAGLGLNATMAFQIANQMSWQDAMGLVVLEGLLICFFAVTGLREAIMNALPLWFKYSIGAGIGLFIAEIGLHDGGFISAPQGGALLQLGKTGTLDNWPVLVFVVGLLLTLILKALRVPAAILVSIIATTIFAMIVEANATISDKSWNLVVPKVPHHYVSKPDFGLFGHVSVFGAFNAHVAISVVVTLLLVLFLSDFFDAMGTIVGVSGEAGLLDANGRPPRLPLALLIDGAAAGLGGVGSASSNTAFVESAAGVGEGARTGLASVVTAILFGLSTFLTPLTSVVPSEAAAGAALVPVGVLMMWQLVRYGWEVASSGRWTGLSIDDSQVWIVAVTILLIVLLMPATFSITNGIGAGIIVYTLLKTVTGRLRDLNWATWGVTALFLFYFMQHPINVWLGH